QQNASGIGVAGPAKVLITRVIRRLRSRNAVRVPTHNGRAVDGGRDYWRMQPPTGDWLEAKIGHNTILVEDIDDVIAQESCTCSKEPCRRSIARGKGIKRKLCAIAKPLPVAEIVYPEAPLVGPA